MSGTINIALSQRFDKYGDVLDGGKLYIIQAGTTATPQNAFQDAALTIPLPNPITLDAAGNVPPFFLADGTIKIRLTDKFNVSQLEYDNLQVIGASSGGGGGGTVDPTTILQTGDPLWRLRTGVMSGFVRMNARTIGSATSGATERANADTAALYDFLWQNLGDFVCPVTGGRGGSSGADFAANKPIGLPDMRGRAPFGLADMGNAASTTLSNAVVSQGSNTSPGSIGGVDSQLITQSYLPNVGLSVISSGVATVNSTVSDVLRGSSAGLINLTPGGGSVITYLNAGPVSQAITSSGGITVAGTTGAMGSGQIFQNISPFRLGTWFVKL